jgi:hypothetical protein
MVGSQGIDHDQRDVQAILPTTTLRPDGLHVRLRTRATKTSPIRRIRAASCLASPGSPAARHGWNS